MARKKPCEFCQEDQQMTQEGPNGHQLCVEFYPNNGLLAVTSFANDEVGESRELVVDLSVNYCPECRRRIGCL